MRQEATVNGQTVRIGDVLVGGGYAGPVVAVATMTMGAPATIVYIATGGKRHPLCALVSGDSSSQGVPKP